MGLGGGGLGVLSVYMKENIGYGENQKFSIVATSGTGMLHGAQKVG